MAPDPPPELVLAGRNLRAQLFAISGDGRFNLLAQMEGLTCEGAEILIEEPYSPAITHPGDLLLSILYEGRIRMAYISKVDVGGDVGSEDGGSTVDSEAEEDGDSISTDEEGDSSSTDPKHEEERCSTSSSTNSEDDQEKEQSAQSSTASSSCSSLVTEAEVNERNRSLQIRLWSEFCDLVHFESECWKLTKQQPIQWLQEQQMEEIHPRIITENESVEIDITRNLDFVDLCKQRCILGLTGFLECSEDVEKFIHTERNPDIINYNISKVLGHGATCKVYAVDTKYAIKKMKLTKKFDDTDALKSKEPREIIILSSFRCSAVVRFFQAWAVDGIFKSYLEGSSDDSSDSDDDLDDGAIPRYVAIQMEYCGRTLSEYLYDRNREMDVEESWFIFKEIVKAVQLTHRSGVIHRDLKPDNIFFGNADTNAIKLGDFGHACWAKQYAAGEAGTPNRGTEWYCAPELDAEASPPVLELNAKIPTDKADIYSLGIIFLELFSFLRSKQGRYKVLGKFKAGEDPESPGGDVDVVLLRKLTAVSPSERLSADEILEYISGI